MSVIRSLAIGVLGSAVLASVGVVGQSPDADDAAVVKAVIRDFVWKEAVRFNRPEDGPPQLALAKETLGHCDVAAQPAIPCLRDEVLELAGRVAATGRWSPTLRVALAARNGRAAAVPPIDYVGVVTGARLDLQKAYPRARNMSVSLPAYTGNEALVYVQWGHVWSGLVLVRRSPDGWRVTDQEVYSVS